jgi:MFS family permease
MPTGSESDVPSMLPDREARPDAPEPPRSDPERPATETGVLDRAGDPPGKPVRKQLYLVGMFIDTIGSGLWMPIGLIFFVNAQGIPLSQVGTALTVGGIAGLALGPLGGSLVDRWGPALFIVLSNVIRAGVFLLYPLVGAAWQIAVLAACFSAADRLFWTANTPLLGSLAAGRQLDRLLATQNVVRIVGLGVGAGIGGLLLDSTSGLHALAYINAVSYVVAGVVLFLAMDLSRWARPARAADRPGDGTGTTWSAILADRAYLLLCLVQTQFALCAVSLVVILPLVSLEPLGGPSWLPGTSIVVGNVVLAVAQTPLVRAAGHTSRLRGLLLASMIFGVTFLLLVPADQVGRGGVITLVLAAAALGVVGEALFAPLMTAAANESAPEALRGRYSALFQTSWGLATVLAPMLFTALLTVGYEVLWLALLGLALSVVPGLLLAARRLPPAVMQS